MTKSCTNKHCQQENPQDESEFYKDKTRKDGLQNWCKDCLRKYKQSDKGKESDKRYFQTEKGKIVKTESSKKWRRSEKGKLQRKEYAAKYRKTKQYKNYRKNFEESGKGLEARRKYKKTKKGKLAAKKYAQSQTVKERKREKWNEKRKDPCYRLSDVVSWQVWHGLKTNCSCKNGESCWMYLSYTIQELKEHLEKQFEPWMNWENYGKYEEGKQKWQIDHIIPQSKLPYDSMEHENFQKCWTLENLRPLEVIENIRKGNKIIS